jgi:tetratricopeptide (TPR) repeat protein
LDKLTHLQNTGRVSDERRDLSSAWEHNIKLDIPEMGLSLGEISRLLTRRFGHDVHIDGDLVETPTGGLALTVRGSSVPPKTFSGSVGELDKVTREAAEYVMAKSRPATWVSYLGNIGRHKEAVEFCRANIASVIDPAERADLFDRWATVTANAGGPQTEALVLYQEALKLKPDLWVTRSNVQNTLMVLGKEEDAWRAGEDMRKAAGGRPGRALEYDYSNWDYLTWNLQTWLAATIADAATNHGFGTSAVGTATLVKADIQWRLHELEAAALSLKTVTANPGDPVIGAMAHFIKGRLAAEEGHAEEAAAEMEAFGMAYANPIVFSNFAGYHCWIALAEEAARHPDKADALLNTAGTYVDCYRFHADILDGRGDWLGAQKAYEEAVALAPDLPAAYFAWGLALARHGDISGAVAKLKDANRRGPHWADPLKAWGDVLVKQGKTKEALAKYADALRYAPNWNQLKEAREVLTKQKS